MGVTSDAAALESRMKVFPRERIADVREQVIVSLPRVVDCVRRDDFTSDEKIVSSFRVSLVDDAIAFSWHRNPHASARILDVREPNDLSSARKHFHAGRMGDGKIAFGHS